MRARTKPRRPISTAGHCRNHRGAQWDVVLSDLAAGGCRIAGHRGQLAQREHVRLYIAGTGPHRAQVSWVRGNEAGIAFAQPLSPEMLERLCEPQGQGNLASPNHGQSVQTGDRATAALVRSVC